MRYSSAEYFSYATNSAAATASFTLTASARNILVESITTLSDLSGAIVRIDASGSTLWQMTLGSSVTYHFPGLTIDCGDAQTMSGYIAGSGSASIAVCGRYRWL